MKESLTFAFTESGISIIINDYESLNDLIVVLKNKFDASPSFFENAEVNLFFKKPAITSVELWELERIMKTYNIKPGIIKTGYAGETYRPIKSKPVQGDEAIILRKGMRSGETLIMDKDIIILGNVNTGSEIRTNGSVFVFGNLKGNVKAGIGGNKMAVIIATNFEPVILEISGKRYKGLSDGGFKIAKYKNDMVVVEDYNPKNLKGGTL
jgi:septum site-determining protein MinC